MLTRNSISTRDDFGEYQMAPAEQVSWSTSWQPQAASSRSREKEPAPKGRPLNDRPGPAWLLISALFAGAIASGTYFIQQGHIVGTIAAPILLLPALHGIWRGGVRKILILPVLLATFWCLIEAPAKVAPYIQPYVEGYNITLIHVLIAAMALPVLLVGMFLVRNIRRQLILPNNTAFRVDRFVGALAGLAEGGLMVLSICWVSVFMAPQMHEALANDRLPRASLQRNVAESFVQIANEAQTGKLGEIVARTNILAHVPELRARIDAWARQAAGQTTSTGSFNFQDVFRIAPDVTSTQTDSIKRTSQEVNRRMENLQLQLPSSR